MFSKLLFFQNSLNHMNQIIRENAGKRIKKILIFFQLKTLDIVLSLVVKTNSFDRFLGEFGDTKSLFEII